MLSSGRSGRLGRVWPSRSTLLRWGRQVDQRTSLVQPLLLELRLSPSSSLQWTLKLQQVLEPHIATIHTEYVQVLHLWTFIHVIAISPPVWWFLPCIFTIYVLGTLFNYGYLINLKSLNNCLHNETTRKTTLLLIYYFHFHRWRMPPGVTRCHRTTAFTGRLQRLFLPPSQSNLIYCFAQCFYASFMVLTSDQIINCFLKLLLFLAAIVLQLSRRRVLSRMFQHQPLWVGRFRSWISKIIIHPRSHLAWLARSCHSRSSLCRHRHRHALQLWVLTRPAARAPLPSFLQRARRHTSGRTARRSSTPFSARAALSRSSGKPSLFWPFSLQSLKLKPESGLFSSMQVRSESECNIWATRQPLLFGSDKLPAECEEWPVFRTISACDTSALSCACIPAAQNSQSCSWMDARRHFRASQVF